MEIWERAGWVLGASDNTSILEMITGNHRHSISVHSKTDVEAAVPLLFHDLSCTELRLLSTAAGIICTAPHVTILSVSSAVVVRVKLCNEVDFLVLKLFFLVVILVMMLISIVSLSALSVEEEGE